MAGLMSSLELPTLRPSLVTPRTYFGAIEARRYDELRTAADRSRQRVEDYEDELRRRQQAQRRSSGRTRGCGGA